MRSILFICIVGLLFFSCKKDKTHAGKKVEIYLLKGYRPAMGPCKVDETIAVLEAEPLVADSDIKSYSMSNFSYAIKDSAFKKISNLSMRTPFAVTVDKRVIYYGIYMPLIASSTCDQSITMHEDFTMKGIVMQLGYPALYDGMDIADHRNDPELLATLIAQSKLIP